MGTVGSEPFVQFVPMEGSPVHVGGRDRAARAREAMTDLRLAIDGCGAQPRDGRTDTAASLARTCSMFLRKMVLGDTRNPRLLDGDLWQTTRLGCGRIRKVPRGRRAITLTPVNVTGGYMSATRLDEETLEPVATEIIPFGPQRFSIIVEWPLPGMADWLSQPSEDSPWEIRPEGLFASQPDQRLDCDKWLGQQVVIFDDRGITLKDIIRVTANTEGAHSPPLERLMIPPRGDDRSRSTVARDSHIHILSHITVCGVRYSHAVVIQAALYLYGKLARDPSFGQPRSDLDIPVICCVPEDVFSAAQDWLRFDGGLMLSMTDTGQSIEHRVKAPRR